MERLTSSTPSSTARLAGFFYLITIVTRMVAESMVRHRIVVSSDAVMTATNILTNQQLFLLGFVADIFSFASYVVLTALLHDLFKRVYPRLSLVAVFLSLMCCAAQAFSSVFQLVALFLLRGSDYLNVFTTGQLQALALISMKIRAVAYHNVGLVFLGFYCLVIGYLVFRSTFMPRIIGALMALGGLAYMPFLSPPVAAFFMPHLLIPVGIGQTAFTLWLLIFGVNSEKWLKRSTDAEARFTPRPIAEEGA